MFAAAQVARGRLRSPSREQARIKIQSRFL